MRASPIFEYSDTALIIVTLVGCTTALFAASIALMLNDIKKVIAYSTMSQLGYTFLACGISGYDIAIFHIVNHGFFKALLFMSAGAVLHALNDEQNTNKMGGLINILPFTYTVMLIGSLSLMALPFLTGFYSKDMILEFSYGQYLLGGSIGYWIGTTTAFLTSVYSIKILILTFMGKPNGSKINYKTSHEPNLIMTIPLILLAVSSIVFGYIFKDLFIGLGSDFWLNSIFIHPNHIKLSDSEFSLPLIIKLLPLICSLLGGIIAYLFYFFFPLYISEIFVIYYKNLIYLLASAYWLDWIYNKLVIYSTFKLAHQSNKLLDRGIIEIIGPFGLTNLFSLKSSKLASYDSGIIPNYTGYIFTGLISLLFLILLPFNFKFILFFLLSLFFI